MSRLAVLTQKAVCFINVCDDWESKRTGKCQVFRFSMSCPLPLPRKRKHIYSKVDTYSTSWMARSHTNTRFVRSFIYVRCLRKFWMTSKASNERDGTECKSGSDPGEISGTRLASSCMARCKAGWKIQEVSWVCRVLKRLAGGARSHSCSTRFSRHEGC